MQRRYMAPTPGMGGNASIVNANAARNILILLVLQRERVPTSLFHWRGRAECLRAKIFVAWMRCVVASPKETRDSPVTRVPEGAKFSQAETRGQLDF